MFRAKRSREARRDDRGTPRGSHRRQAAGERERFALYLPRRVHTFQYQFDFVRSPSAFRPETCCGRRTWRAALYTPPGPAVFCAVDAK